MNANVNPMMLVTGGSVAFVAAGVSLFVADRRTRAAAQRISSVTTMRSQLDSAPGQTSRRAGARAPNSMAMLGKVLSYAGIAVDRPDLYPLPWWIILTISCFATVAFAAAVNFLIGSVSWIFLPVDMVIFTRFVFVYFRNRRSAKLYLQLPDALTMITRSVRAGFTVQDAIRIVGDEGHQPTTTEFRHVIDEVRMGATLQTALAKLAHRSGLLEYRFLAVAVALQTQSGGNLSETLENLADVVRKRVGLKQRGIALSAEARTTMYVLGCLPFFIVGGLMFVSPDYLTPMISTVAGKKLLFVGLTLYCLGFGSMKYIIRKSVS